VLWTTYTNPIVLEFVAGVWLAKAWTAGRMGGWAAGLAAIVCGCALLTAVAVLGGDPTGAARLYLWGAPALLIVWGALCLERAGRAGRLPVLKLLGDASYSIYLVHGLALSLAFKLLSGIPQINPWIALACAMPFAVALGVVCYFVVERPLLKAFHPGRKAVRPASARSRPSGNLDLQETQPHLPRIA
jgi:exopolysaccharide production protein ExoZ